MWTPLPEHGAGARAHIGTYFRATNASWLVLRVPDAAPALACMPRVTMVSRLSWGSIDKLPARQDSNASSVSLTRPQRTVSHNKAPACVRRALCTAPNRVRCIQTVQSRIGVMSPRRRGPHYSASKLVVGRRALRVPDAVHPSAHAWRVLVQLWAKWAASLNHQQEEASHNAHVPCVHGTE